MCLAIWNLRRDGSDAERRRSQSAVTSLLSIVLRPQLLGSFRQTLASPATRLAVLAVTEEDYALQAYYGRCGHLNIAIAATRHQPRREQMQRLLPFTGQFIAHENRRSQIDTTRRSPTGSVDAAQ